MLVLIILKQLCRKLDKYFNPYSLFIAHLYMTLFFISTNQDPVIKKSLLFYDVLMSPLMTYGVILYSAKDLCLYNVSNHRNTHKNRFINEYATKKKPKIP